MDEFKKFVKNENDNWEEYKDLINEDTKFMMFDGENAKELSVSETIHQLRLDNKYLGLQIINLQSKIDKANQILDKLEMQPAYLDCKYYELDGFNELRNVLKEDK